MSENINEVLEDISRQMAEADNSHDAQCNDMTLNHLKIAREWQRRKIKKPPDFAAEIDVGALMSNRLR